MTPDWLTYAEAAAYLTGGPLGILAAMETHPRLRAWYEKRRARP